MKMICVFCSSSSRTNPIHSKTVESLAISMVEKDMELVWGGADVGLMGVLASEMQKVGGIVHGIIPKFLVEKNLDYRGADELIITRDFSIRKQVMNDMSDAFICLPGGFGTIEEITEIITLKQLGILDKPIVFINTARFFDSFIGFIDHMVEEQFLKKYGRKLFVVVDSADEALDHILNYRGIEFEEKW